MLQFFLIRPCSLHAKFCLLCKKVCQQEATSTANDFFHQPKFSQLPANFKNTVENQRRPKIFLPGNKILCSLTRVSFFSDHLILRTWPFQWLFWLFEKFRVSDAANKGEKRKIGDYKNFVVIRCQTNSLVKIDSSTAFQFKNFWHS